MLYFKPNAPAVSALGKTLIGFNLINGREVEGEMSSFESRSAADSRDIVGVFPECGPNDVARAARAAADAFPAWSEVPAPRRGAILQRIGAILQENQEKFARILTREIGKTPLEALSEVQEAIDTCMFFGGEGRRLHGQAAPGERAGQQLSTCRKPVGVCGILTANSSPLAGSSRKLIPALLCGNTIVWKPSEDAPTIAYLFASAMVDAGLPAGVVNVVHGKGRTGCGKHFLAGIEKGYYQKFSFTGSTALGRVIGELCGRNLMIPSLELGAKNPMIVMEDADLERAVHGAILSAFGAAGQSNTSLANLILHEPIAKPFKERFLEEAAKLLVGNPVTHPEVQYGPMINTRFAKAFAEHWKMGAGDPGVRLLMGGAQWTEANGDGRVHGNISHGAYMQPCIWDEVTPDAWLFHNEVFGPTVNLCTVKDFDQALEYANGTPYGLASALYTENRTWVERFKRGTRAGLSSINTILGSDAARLPFGGNDWSGNGTRENGPWALDAYTRWQGISDDCSGKNSPAQAETEPRPRTAAKPTNWEAL